MRVRELLLDALKESLVFCGIALLVALLVAEIFRLGYLDSFGFVLLIESCGLMLVGGAMDLLGAPGIRKMVSLLGGRRVPVDGVAESRAGNGAAVYALTGVILFLASLALAGALAL